MTISFKSHIDDGDPSFIRSDSEFQIVCEPGDRGRWLGDYLEPLEFGKEMTILAQMRTSCPEETCGTILLTWWKNEPGMVLHSVENAGEMCGTQTNFKQIIYNFRVPHDVKLLRIDLRAWGGAGTRIWRDIRLVPKDEPDPPLPTPDPPGPDEMLTVDLDLVNVKWRITASRESVTALRIVPEDL
jgi:hypothetical protein